jgi:CubicO group peptidase (beta-lactamase class C family)
MSAASPLMGLEFSSASSRLSPKVREKLTSELLNTLDTSFPAGFNAAVVEKSETIFRAWGGLANAVDPVVPTSRDTLYDLASLSKVVSTTTLVLWLEQTKRWKLTDSVAKWLPGFPREDITLFQLLTHTSGLIPHLPFFHLGQDARAVRRAVYVESANGGPVGSVSYSDLNFMLLGWAVARCSGTTLNKLFEDVVATPLGMRHTHYRPALHSRARTAATELNGDQRLEPTLVWGEVHDGNAWSLGGVAGHAGLFAPTDDLGRFVTALLNPRRHPVLSASTITRMARFQAGRLPDVRGLGWRLEPTEWGSWPEGTFWHTGFTGTSLLISPNANLGVVLLTNAVHPVRQLERQEVFRTTIHRTILEIFS